jgi:hypothetical protein
MYEHSSRDNVLASRLKVRAFKPAVVDGFLEHKFLSAVLGIYFIILQAYEVG